jgi:hypothetical protein
MQFMNSDHDEKWSSVYGCVAKELDVVIARYRDDTGVIQWRIDVAGECHTSTYNARKIVEKLGGVFGAREETEIVSAWQPSVIEGKRIGVLDRSMSGLDVRRKLGVKTPKQQMPRHKSSVEVRGQFQALDPKNPFA